MDGCSLLGGRTREQKILDVLQSTDQARKHEMLLELKGEVSPAVLTAVEGVLTTDPDPGARVFAADALGRLARPPWRVKLGACPPAAGTVAQLRRSAREDSDELVRARATGALVRILGPGAAEDLQFSLENDRNLAVRIEAIRLAADALGTKQAAQLIVEGLRDDVPRVRLAAYVALRDLTGQDISPNDYERWLEHVNGL
jgi:hypothetical protein